MTRKQAASLSKAIGAILFIIGINIYSNRDTIVTFISEVLSSFLPFFFWALVMACFTIMLLYYFYRYQKRQRLIVELQESDKRFQKKREQENSSLVVSISSVDDMKGIEFENYIHRLLEFMNFNVETTPKSGDYGVDLIVVKNNNRTAVQCKRYKKNIGVDAIQQVYAGMQMYDCSRAMVVTNQYFTKQAQSLAQSNGVILIDRTKLGKWIKKYKKERIRERQSLLEDVMLDDQFAFQWMMVADKLDNVSTFSKLESKE